LTYIPNTNGRLSVELNCSPIGSFFSREQNQTGAIGKVTQRLAAILIMSAQKNFPHLKFDYDAGLIIISRR